MNALSADSSVGSTIEVLEAELPHLQKQQEALKGDLEAVTKRLEAVSTALSSLQALSTSAAPEQGGDGTPVAVAEPVAQATDAQPAAESATEATAEAAEPESAEDTATTGRASAATRKAAIGRQRSGGKAGKAPATGRATKAAAKKTAAKKTAAKATAKAPKSAKATVKATKATAKTAKSTKAAEKPAEKATKETVTTSERSTGLSDSVLAALRKAGRPMRASEVNEALGRDETRTNVNSVRNTLERLRSSDRAQRSGRGLYEATATS
ncbi:MULTISPECIES: prephenate dehydrogenase [unclassified Streptomyces]|uniref:prephenate dehydrogenase n=1 Tax=unclassified Streptomyces TaxID=2593676 RepID=UPI00168A4EA7|nr:MULTISPECIES: prephenate dehydrogenase [unclassified Streptomyces]MBD3002834.1 prephenate dehydrogenase [Streptomyces sp. 5-10]